MTMRLTRNTFSKTADNVVIVSDDHDYTAHGAADVIS